MEIEKKYLLSKIPENLSAYTCYDIEQGYLCGSPVVRIRKKNSDYILTYKSRQFFKTTQMIPMPDNVCACEEVELPLTKEAYEHLLGKIDNNIVTKKRYNIPLYGDFIAELDVFSGRLDGLVVVEVEFRDALQASIFVKPSWFGEDVSTNNIYGNSSLSKLDSWL